MKILTKFFFSAALSASVIFAEDVQALEAPTGPVILVVSGKLGNTNVGDEAHFDREMLKALPQHETVTHTPWHDGEVSFVGPLGRDLLEAVGAEATNMHITALNDYAVDVPVDDFMTYDVLLAMSANGRALRVRDQGPIFIIYPFDERPELRNDITVHRSVWQVKRIDLK
ncbi:molybdopterin-dependent oxidoreductase [Onishia taeanensis]|nr:molybdopterin-dependent oxidoreductase [Halomonas taeanensis]